MSESPSYFAVRTLRALEVLTFTPTTAPRVAEALGIHPRTARRLLSQLQRDGWLSYNPHPPHVYAPTLRMVALAGHIGARAPLATATAPAVEQLHADTGLDALLAIPSYDATLCLVRCSGERAVQPPLGNVTPAHCTAAGKVLMAHRDAWRRSILAAPLMACTDRSLTDPAALEREFTRVRLDGYAGEDGEHRDGVRQLAAPVTGPGGEVLAAIEVASHDSRPLRELVPHVRHAARTASEALAGAAERYPLHRGVVYRMLASYGLAPVTAYL
jgi:DNA-binding IclR family transcriptional regulator